MVSFPQVSPVELCAHLSPPPYAPHASPINRNEYQEYLLGVKSAGSWSWQPYHLYVPIVLKSGSLNLLEPSESVQVCKGTALLYNNYQLT